MHSRGFWKRYCIKTTLTERIRELSDGEVRIEGRRVNELSSRERNVAMSFENYGLYPDFTIYDNIAYPLKIHKESPEKIKEKVMDIAKNSA